jgi:hypothetical protein
MMCYPAITSTGRNDLDRPLSAELRRRREEQIAQSQMDRDYAALSKSEREQDEIELNHYRGE